MPPQAYRVGAVVYHEKVRQIWDAFGDWFSEQGLTLEVRFFDAYADQVRALVLGELDTAWNTNLAYAHTLQLTDGGAHAIAMRDTDLGWRSHIVARDDDGHHGLADLQGARVGFGDADSPQAHILPVHALLQEGVDRARTSSRPGLTATWVCTATRAAPNWRSWAACAAGSSMRASYPA